jgi:hypothetical protein
MRRLGVLLLAVFLGAGVLAAGPAAATPDFDVATCSPASLGGSATWTPALSTTTTSSTFSATVTATCTGPGDEAGSWMFNFTASTSETGCGAGTGSGTVSVFGPESFTSTFTYTRQAMILELHIRFGDLEGDEGTLALVAQTNLSGCPASPSALAGIGAVADTSPPVTASAGIFQGSGTVIPGLPLAFVATIWTLTGTVNGFVNGSPGTCTFNATWTAGDNLLASVPGTGTGSCTTATVSTNCPTITAIRVGTFLALDAPCMGGQTMSLRLTLAFEASTAPRSFTATGAYSIV